MIDPKHLLDHVISPVLRHLDILVDKVSDNSRKQILGTACKESECGKWLHQLGRGPAVGIYQMEPFTHDDIWDNYLKYQPDLADKVLRWSVSRKDGADEMHGNLYYATAMCRIYYYRVPAKIPSDLPGQAAYWKKYYNTIKGKGTEQEYIDAWNTYADSGLFV